MTTVAVVLALTGRPIEKENKTIRACVHPPNESNVTRFVHQLNFTQPVSDGLRAAFRHNREASHGRRLRNVDAEVEKCKQLLCKMVVFGNRDGPLLQPYHQAVRLPKQRSDLMDNVTTTNQTPWAKQRAALLPNNNRDKNYQEFVEHHLNAKVTWQ